MTITGKTLTLTYDSGLVVRGRYGPDSVTWEALSGPAQGSAGTEHTYVHELSPTFYFVNWIESSGTIVSQVLDLESRQVWSFISYRVDGARQAMLDRGSVSVTEGG
jgi:hypothetical protein